MKYVVCVPDGCADEPVDELGGRTPLEVADDAHLDALAARGEVGRAAVIPEGMPPGSDVGNMSILGYDPAEFHTGRAPIEAASLGLKLPADRFAYRCNLVTVGDDGTMVDFAGGHPSTEAAAEVDRRPRRRARLGVRLGPRVPPRGGVPPHHGRARRLGRRRVRAAARPDRPARGVAHRRRPPAEVREVMDASRAVMSRFDLDARQPGLALGSGVPADDAVASPRTTA